MWYLCILHQAWLMWHLEDIASASGGTLTVEQKGKLDLAMALVASTQVPLCCNVCMHSHCCTMELHTTREGHHASEGQFPWGKPGDLVHGREP